MFDLTYDKLNAVYEQLKKRYPLTLTHSFAVDDGFSVDCPLLMGQSHGRVLWLYEDCGEFVLDVMNAEKTVGTHWHPSSVSDAVDAIVEFMEGNCDRKLRPFLP